MKYLILIFVFLIPTLNFAQHEFAPIGAEWYYNKQSSYNPPEFGFTKLTSIKDSIIDNKEVRVIEVIDAPNDSTRTIEGYEYLHQSGDTIWYWKGNQFHLLYNFAMQKGDSILLYSEMVNQCTENDPYGWNRVDSVFTRTFNEIKLKTYSSIPISNSVWGFYEYSYEIFGNSNYLIPQNYDCVYDYPGYGSLRCYSDPTNGILIVSEYAKCDSTYKYTDTYSTQVFRNTDFLSIYPVPVESELNIQFQNNSIIDKNTAIEIIDNRGISIRKYKYAIDKIDVSDLPKGTYFLIISLNNKYIEYEKFIKK